MSKKFSWILTLTALLCLFFVNCSYSDSPIPIEWRIADLHQPQTKNEKGPMPTKMGKATECTWKVTTEPHKFVLQIIARRPDPINNLKIKLYVFEQKLNGIAEKSSKKGVVAGTLSVCQTFEVAVPEISNSGEIEVDIGEHLFSSKTTTIFAGSNRSSDTVTNVYESYTIGNTCFGYYAELYYKDTFLSKKRLVDKPIDFKEMKDFNAVEMKDLTVPDWDEFFK